MVYKYFSKPANFSILVSQNWWCRSEKKDRLVWQSFSNKNPSQQPEHSVLSLQEHVYLHLNIRADVQHEVQLHCFVLVLCACSKNPDRLKTKTTSSTNTLSVTVTRTLTVCCKHSITCHFWVWFLRASSGPGVVSHCTQTHRHAPPAAQRH